MASLNSLVATLLAAKPAPDATIEPMPVSQRVPRTAIGRNPTAVRAPTFYAYAHPAPEGFKNATLTPAAAHWDESLGGEFVLDWDDICSSPHPYETALEFVRSVVLHACTVCGWDPHLSASVEGVPPPVV